MMVAATRDYRLVTLMRRAADKDEREAERMDAEGDPEAAEELLARIAILRARADVYERDEGFAEEAASRLEREIRQHKVEWKPKQSAMTFG